MKLPDAAQFRDRLLPITLSQGIGFLCGLIGVRISTKLISPADYGAFGVFMTFTPLGMWVVHAGLIKFTARHWAESSDRGALLREVLRAGASKLPWLVVATLAAALAMNTAGFLRLWPALFVAASLLSVGLLAQTALQAERSHWKDFVVSTAASVSRSFFPPLLYFFAGGSLLALETGFGLHTAVFSGGCLYLLSKYRVAEPTSPPQLKAVYEGPLFVLLSLASWLLSGVNRWLMAAFFGAETAGYFTLAGNVALIVTSMLGLVFVQYFQPGLFAAASEEPAQRRLLARRVDLIAASYCAISLAGVATLRWIAPWLIGPLIDQRYASALVWILPAGYFSVTTMAGYFYHVMLLAGRREKACGRVDLTTAGILVVAVTIAASQGQIAFRWALMFSPVLIWVLTRPMARAALFTKPAEPQAPSPAHGETS